MNIFNHEGGTEFRLQIISAAMTSFLKGPLERFLSEYVYPGYDLSFHSSEIILRNVQLRVHLLPSSLPFHITLGLIEHMSIKVSYRALTSQPVEISLDQIFVLIGPKRHHVCSNHHTTTTRDGDSQESSKDSGWSPSHERAAYLADKLGTAACEWNEDPIQKQLLDFIQLYLCDPASGSDSSSSSYTSQMTSKILRRALNNVSVTLNDFHCRYEDELPRSSRSSSSSDDDDDDDDEVCCHAMGLEIGCLKTFATNESWTLRSFYDQLFGTFRRVVSCQDIAVYCDPFTRSIIPPNVVVDKQPVVPAMIFRVLTELRELNHEGHSKSYQWWDSFMEDQHQHIGRAGVTNGSPLHHYILCPVATCTFRLVTKVSEPNNEEEEEEKDDSERRRSYDCSAQLVECDALQLALDSDQLVVFHRLSEHAEHYQVWQDQVRRSIYFQHLRELSLSDCQAFYHLIQKKKHQQPLGIDLSVEEIAELNRLTQRMPLNRLVAYQQPGTREWHDLQFTTTSSSSLRTPRSVNHGVASEPLEEVIVAFNRPGALGLDIEMNPMKYGQ